MLSRMWKNCSIKLTICLWEEKKLHLKKHSMMTGKQITPLKFLGIEHLITQWMAIEIRSSINQCVIRTLKACFCNFKVSKHLKLAINQCNDGLMTS